MLRAEPEDRIEIPADGRQRLARRGGHEVDAHGDPPDEQPIDRPPHVVWSVVAIERRERRRVERLSTEAHPRHAAVHGGGEERVGHVEWIGLDRHLRRGRRPEAPTEQAEEPPQALRAEV